MTTYLKKTQQSDSKITIKKFYGDLFATIKDLTGGAISLFLTQDDKAPPENPRILVKNDKEPPQDPPKVVEFDPLPKDGKGDGVTINIKMSGKVPKGVQAEAFGGTPSSGQTYGPVNLMKDEDEVPEAEVTEGLKIRLDEAFENLAYNDFDSESVSGAKAVLKELVDGEPIAKVAEKSTIPYPLEMECITQGIDGWKFGDTVTSRFLPAIYKKTSGLRIAFTVTKINNKIQGKKWITELTTVCRMINN